MNSSLLMRRRNFLGMLATFLATFIFRHSSATLAQSSEKLWSLLQQADETCYVILFRHAIAPGIGDPPNFQLNDCSNQRNLSEEGRQQAIGLGEAIKSRNIPLTRVLSSQWCRCLETAKLMDVGKVEPYEPLNSFFENRQLAEVQTSQVRQFLLENEHEPGVIIMISHQVNIMALTQVSLGSGEGVVLQVHQDTPQIEVLGRLAT